MKRYLKTRIVRLLFDFAFSSRLTRAAVYSHQPFPKWPYLFTPKQMRTLADLLLSVQGGNAVEIGCNQGWISAYLCEVMREAGVEHPYVGIDTFNGFLPQDIKAEYARGKQYGTFDDAFRTTKQVWYDFSLAHAGYNVRSYKADASTFDYSAVAPIGFALIDVDLYRPVLLALRAAWPHVQPGGVIVVDDCDPTHKMWDGAHQAYLEFCSEHAITPQILDGKLGIIHH